MCGRRVCSEALKPGDGVGSVTIWPLFDVSSMFVVMMMMEMTDR